MNNCEDKELMLAASQGDRGAFGILVERHHAAIIQFVHAFLSTQDRSIVEDLAQDVFLAAWDAAPSFRRQATVLTWLLRIARNRCLNYRRGSRLRVVASLDVDRPPVSSTPNTDGPEARLIGRERADRVNSAIGDLPPNQRSAMLLRHFQGLSYVEIADVLNTSESAVESLLFRARRTLEASLAAENDASPQVSSDAGVYRDMREAEH
jgi:RNA polymerase sigma-70 factor (ECF subfamily)